MEDATGRSVYLKSDDCIGEAQAAQAALSGSAPQPPTALPPPACPPALPSCTLPSLPSCPCTPGCLRDLQRFFRYDDPEMRPAFFAVSKYNFARSDLVPLIVTYPEDYEVVYNAREWLAEEGIAA